MPGQVDAQRASFRVVFRVASDITGDVQSTEFGKEFCGPGASLIHGRIYFQRRSNWWGKDL